MSTVYWPAVDPHVTEEAGTRGGTHTGIDCKAALGDPVLAAFDGTVVYVGGDGASGRIWLGDRWLYPNGEGKTVDIRRDDGLISRVGHLNGYAVKQGQRVKAGDTVGYAGTTGYSTGVHIHWETRWDRAWVGGRWENPRNFKPAVFKKASPEPEEAVMRTLYNIDNKNEDTRRATVGELTFKVERAAVSTRSRKLWGKPENVTQGEWDAEIAAVNQRRKMVGLEPIKGVPNEFYDPAAGDTR